MNEEQFELLKQDLCSRLSHGVKIRIAIPFLEESDYPTEVLSAIDTKKDTVNNTSILIENVKSYLRSMEDMTEEEARKIVILSGILTPPENILSISVEEEFIGIEIDDGVFGIETRILWFTEMPTSISLFDYLNAHHFDYRGLIEKGLALEAPEDMYNIK